MLEMMATYKEYIQEFVPFIQEAGNWLYIFCGTHIEAIKLGVIAFTLALCLCSALRSRRFLVRPMWLILALGCAFMGQIYLHERAFHSGIALYVASSILAFIYCSVVSGEHSLSEIAIGRSVTVMLLACIIGCASFMRFYRLSDYPAGLNNDEALFSYYGLLTMRGEPLHGWWHGPARFLAIHLYSLAAVFKVFGAGITTARSASGVVGILGVVACFLMADQLFKRAVALLAAFSLALCFCCSGFDRLSICLNWGVPFACMGVYLLLLAERQGKKFLGFLSGFVLGLGVWTYDVYKGFLLVIAIFIFLRVLFSRGYLREAWPALALLIMGFLAATDPLLQAQKAHTLGYMKNVFVLVGNAKLPQGVSSPQFILTNLQKIVKMLFVAMSESIHLIRAGPMLNDALVPLFFMGFVYALYNWKRYNYFLVLLWFIISPIGGILSWPCTRRIIIFMPALHICVALGAVLLFRALEYSIGFNWRKAFPISLAVLMSVLFAVNADIYFNRCVVCTGYDLKQLGEVVNSQIGERYVYLVDIGVNEPAIYFMSYNGRKGEDIRKYYDGIGGKDINDRILNAAPRDLAFVFWNNGKIPENIQRLESIEKMIPSAKVARKEYILTGTVWRKGLENWRGGVVSYMDCDGDSQEVWAKARASSLDFDWRAYPLPYPFQIELKSFFYAPRDGSYGFQVMGKGETELYVDDDEMSISGAPDNFLKEGMHEVMMRHVQSTPGTLNVMWGMDVKSMRPLYLWSDKIQRLCDSDVKRP